jgi:hypothetical protein
MPANKTEKRVKRYCITAARILVDADFRNGRTIFMDDYGFYEKAIEPFVRGLVGTTKPLNIPRMAAAKYRAQQC